MASFTNKRRYQIETVIDNLGRRLINVIRNEVTHDDIFRCFIKQEHREMVVQMHPLFGMQGSTVFTYQHEYKSGNRCSLSVSLSFSGDDTRFSVPNYCGEGFVEDAPEESVKRISEWVKRRIKIGREFGFAKDTFNAISDRCGSAKAVAFLMPSVIGLVAQIPDDPTVMKFRDALTRAGQPPLPMLTPEMREATEKAAHSFARALLLDSTSENASKIPVSLSVYGIPSVKNPWGTTQTFI
jgi:hypothetical protein